MIFFMIKFKLDVDEFLSVEIDLDLFQCNEY